MWIKRGENVKEERVEEEDEEKKVKKKLFLLAVQTFSMYCDLYLQEKQIMHGNSCIN